MQKQRTKKSQIAIYLKRLSFSLILGLTFSCSGDGSPRTPLESAPDTDADSVPDSSEDRNQNGKVDAGETDPTKADTDGDGILDKDEVSSLACSKENDRPFIVHDVPGALAEILTDGAVKDVSTLRRADQKTPGAEMYDSTTKVSAVVLGEQQSASISIAAYRAALVTKLEAIGTFQSLDTRGLQTQLGDAGEQSRLRLTLSSARNAQDIIHQAAEVFAGGTLSGKISTNQSTATVFEVRILTVFHAADWVSVVLAISAEPNEAQSIRLDELTDGTNIAPRNAFTRHVCDGFVGKGNTAADILFVIDDSGSMKDDQDAVSAAASELSKVLETAKLNYRLAVARMFANGPEASRGTLEGGNFTRDLSVFQSRVRVGAKGGKEYGLGVSIKAADTSLPRSAQEVDTKFRENAASIVVVLSDERDQDVECAACGGCATQESKQVFCSDPAGDVVIDDYIEAFRTRKLTLFGIVSDLPNGCHQSGSTQKENYEPGQGYVEVADATGGKFGSICGNMADNMREIGRVATGAASQYKLSVVPASASLKVAVGPPGKGKVIPRSRSNGFDFDPAQNSIVFYGTAIPAVGDEIYVGYRRFDVKNSQSTPPDGCDECKGNDRCDPNSDVPTCVEHCGETVCDPDKDCVENTGTCEPSPDNPNGGNGNSNSNTNSNSNNSNSNSNGNSGVGTPCPDGHCGSGLVCHPDSVTCVKPCEQTGCVGINYCDTASHICRKPDV